MQFGQYLGHQTVGAGSFFVFEDYVRVVVGHELLEARIVARDLALGESAGAQRVLRHVGHVLLEDERRQLARRPSPIGAPAGTARHGRRRKQSARHHQQEEPVAGQSWTSAAAAVAGQQRSPAAAAIAAAAAGAGGGDGDGTALVRGAYPPPSPATAGGRFWWTRIRP